MSQGILPEERKQETVISAGTHDRPRRHSRGSAERGKLLLIAIFCVLRGIDALIYFGTPSGDKSRLVAALAVGAVWTTAILFGIWCRQNWARYVLIALVLLNIFGYVLLAPDLVAAKGISNPLLRIFIISGIAYVGVALCLIRSRDIRRLSNRSSS